MTQCYDAGMRTTLTLSARVHQELVALAKYRQKSLSETANDLLFERLFVRELTDGIFIEPETGWPLVSLGRPLTSEDVAALTDEDD